MHVLRIYVCVCVCLCLTGWEGKGWGEVERVRDCVCKHFYSPKSVYLSESLHACMCHKSALIRHEKKIQQPKIWQRKCDVCIRKVENGSSDSGHLLLVIPTTTS